MNGAYRAMTRDELQQWLVLRIHELRGLAREAIAPTERFTRHGLDSLMTTRMLNDLATVLGRALPPTLAWEYPTIESLATFLAEGTGSSASPIAAMPERQRSGGNEPIAVIGMACRFPGAPNIEAFWKLLCEGRDAITEVPKDRWDVESFYDDDSDALGKMRTKWGGFLEQVDQFDPQFFGISPREAIQMDPQQRLILELCWEALESAGISALTLKGTRTAVFAGAIWSDYAMLHDRAGVDRLDQYSITGSHHSIIANRISYILGVHGPSFTLDAACSSGLVTVHLACDSLRRGESNLALCPAINLNILQENAIGVERFGALSPDGRCHTFDARANGYVRGEGGGVVVLKRLTDAIRDADPILAVIRGSAVNNDGASNGLTAPNPWAQKALLEEAYRSAGVDTRDVQYVEAHGTGTPLGDPIEAKAIGDILGRGRPSDAPLLIGSAKTNIGHLEGAAGIVGLIKTTLALRERKIPPSLHFTQPNPAIDLDELHLDVPTTLRSFPDPNRILRCGVSSFGLGGTNAHVVLEEWPRFVDDPPLQGQRSTNVDVTNVDVSKGLVFVFPGQGAQWPGMARWLLQAEPVFRATFDRCNVFVREILGFSIVDELLAPPSQSRLDRIDVSLPTIISFDIAMAALWRSKGIEPSAVVGHSTGEIAAAHVCGALDLKDTMRIICAYGKTIAQLSGRGVMALVQLSWEDAARALEENPGLVHLAIEDSVDTTVLAGEPGAMEMALARLQASGVVCRRVNMAVAPHCPLVDGVRAELAEAIRGIRPRSSTIPLFSEVTGGVIPGEALDVDHWVRNFGDNARFSTAVNALIAEGYRGFLDVGPHPITKVSVEKNLRHADCQGIVLGSILRNDEQHAFQETLSTLRLALGFHCPRPYGGQTSRAHILPLSARTSEALLAMVTSYKEWFSHHDEPLHHVAYTASMRRSHLEYRLGVVASTKEEIAAALGAFAAGEKPPGIVTGKTTQSAPKVVFVFPGQGSQWIGMGRQLSKEEPAFRDALAACDEAIRNEAGFSILEELDKPEETSRLSDIDVVQPVLFAVEVALATLWRSWGVEPAAVVGHSMGEVAAAFVAGALSMGDAAAIICRRSRLLRKVAGQGAMALVELTLPNAEKALVGYEDRLSVAVSNGPRSTVIAGDPAALDEVLGKLEREGAFCRRVKVDVASHSPQMDPLREELLSALTSISPKDASIPMRSTVTGERIRGNELSSTYWTDNLRKPVLFSRVIEQWITDGHTIFLEMSPHPILTPAVEENLREANAEGLALASTRRAQDERQTMLSSLGALFVRGVPVAWKAFFPDSGRVIELPTYPWQRERYWIEPSKRTAGNTKTLGFTHSADSKHPLVGVSFTTSSNPDARFWRRSMSVSAIPWLTEHRVQEEIVFPGAGYVECALEAGTEALGGGRLLLEDIAFERMMVFAEDQARDVEVVVTDDGTRKSFRVSSQSENAAWIRHASGHIRLLEKHAEETSEAPHAVASRLPKTIDVAGYYEGIRARQAYHGPAFQGIVELRADETKAVAKIRLPEDVHDEGYVMHPALLDACLQVSGALLSTSLESDTYVPVGIDRLQLYRRPSRELWVVATKSAKDDAAYDLRVMDENGNVFVAIDGLRSQRIDRVARTTDPLDGCIYDVVWRQVKPLEEPKFAPGGMWLVFVDRGGLSDVLADRISTLGQRCIRVLSGSSYQCVGPNEIRIDSSKPDDYRRIFTETFGDDGHCEGVLHLSSLDATPFEETTTESLSADLGQTSVSATYLVQAIVRHGFRDAPRLFLVTRGAQSVFSTDAVSVSQAPILGLGKTITMEYPELCCTRVDLPAERSANDAELLWRELGSKEREDQIALRGGVRHAARLVTGQFELDDTSEDNQAREPACGRPYRLEIRKPGVLDRLALHEVEKPQPGTGEVLIDVEAAGLNFRDVLMALGALPDDGVGADKYGPRIGGECAGRIVAVGNGVSGFVAGQAVIATGARAFGTLMITRHEFCAHKPDNLSWEQAAVLPLVFMTAYFGLEHVGRLRRGERVLIHAGAGGVGLAAIQWAQHVGAEIFATAGSDEKRAHLRALGVPHVLDSRSLSFADEIHRITHGEGVDVVLNSLSGDFIPASLGVLRDWGRFVEIGMRDYYENRPLGTRPFLRNLSFSLLDLRGLMMQSQERAGALLREVISMFSTGVLKPLPVTSFAASHATQAFQYMAQAKHIGKIALVMKDPDARIVPSQKSKSITIHADRTYLITGGLGGLGFSLAQWLVKQGARSLVLVGRKGPSEEARVAIRVLEETGARVRSAQADVSRESDVKELFAMIRDDMPPVGGIVHAAMVLDDHTLLEQSAASFQKVFAPKAFGAWNLHKHCGAEQLDFFVMYSSAASLMGSPGQGNYCASNAYLDALCRERTRQGLPAMSIQWGGFADVGAAAAMDIRGKRLSYRGGGSFSPAEGLEAFRRLRAKPRAEVGVMRFDPRQWVEFYPNTAGVPFFAEVMKQDANREKSASRAKEMRERLQNTIPEERLPLLEQHLLEQFGVVLHLEPSRIDRTAPLQSLGMDSLMSLELRNRLEASLGLRLSATMLFTYTSIARLGNHLLDILFPQSNEMQIEVIHPEIVLDRSLPSTDAEALDRLAEYEEYLQ